MMFRRLRSIVFQRITATGCCRSMGQLRSCDCRRSKLDKLLHVPKEGLKRVFLTTINQEVWSPGGLLDPPKGYLP